MGAIFNFHKISDTLACSGQPREYQLSSIATEGCKVIINLGLLDGKYALTDEATSVKELGMVYHHIPVLFDNPQIDELSLFIEKMNAHSTENILVHCAANYRASVFTGLYLLATAKMNEEEMNSFIEDIWQPNAVWQQFLEEGTEYIKEHLLK